MALVVRFILPGAVASGSDVFIAGAGLFAHGVLDVPAADTAAVSRVRSVVLPMATEVGTLDPASSPPPTQGAGDPYPQYLTLADATASVQGGTDSFSSALKAAYGALPKVASTVTAGGALVANKHNPVDATSGPLTMALPTGQAEGAQVSVEKTDATANAVTVTGSVRGVDSSTLSLPWRNEALLLRADSAGSWWPVAGHKTKASLDAAYVSRGAAGGLYPVDAPATVLSGVSTTSFDANFASGTLTAYANTIHPERVTFIDDPVLGPVRKVIRLDVQDTDTGPTENPRVQLQTPPMFKIGSEYWVGWSTMFPADWPDLPPMGGDGFATFASIYGPPYNGAGPNVLNILGYGPYPNQILLAETYSVMPLVKGQWIDFVVHVVMSSTPGIGLVEIFTCTDNTAWVQRKINGKYTLPYATLKPGVNDGDVNDHRISLYRKVGMFPTMTIYHAAHKIGTSFETVAPKSYPAALRPWEQ